MLRHREMTRLVSVVLATFSSIVATSNALGAPENAQPSIWFGNTAGNVVNMCGRYDPGPSDGYSVKIFPNGQVVTWNIRQSYPVPRLTAADVRGLIQQDRREGFFKVRTRARDVPCPGAATTYIRVHAPGMTRTVEIYGYLDARHARIRRVIETLSVAVNL